MERAAYGLFVLSTDLLLWLSVLDFGLSIGLRAQVAQLTGRPDNERLNQLASTTFFTHLYLSVAVIALGGVLAFAAPNFFEIRPSLQGTATSVLLVLTIGAAITFATQTFSSLLIAHQQIHIDNLIRILLLAIRVLVSVLLLTAGWSVVSLAIASVAAVAVASATSIVRCYVSLPQLHIKYRLASLELLKKITRDPNIWFAVTITAGLMIQSADGLVAARVVGLEAVTTLTLTGRLYLLAFTILAPLTTAAHPGIGQLIGAGERGKAYDTYKRLLLLSTGGAVVLGMAFWSGNAAFVNGWVGIDNYGSRWLDFALMLSMVVNVWLMPSRMVLNVSMQAKPHAMARIAEAILNLGLSIWLAQQLGLVGIPIATVIATLLSTVWCLPVIIGRYFGRSFGSLIWDTTRPLIVPTILLLPVVLLMRYFASTERGYLGAAAAIGGASTCGAAFLWRFAFDAAIREGLLGGRLAAALRTFRKRSAPCVEP
jgi:Na+-driven multidrug efflux pump